MQRRFALLAVAVLALTALAGCSKLQARSELKKGNEFYAQEQYTKALTQFQKGLELDPNAKFAWRSVGMTALALYRPGDDKPENVKYGAAAVEGFEKYLQAYPRDDKIQDYLLSCYVNTKQLDKALQFIDAELARNDAKTRDKFVISKINVLTTAGRLDEALKMALQTEDAEARAQQLYTIGVNAWDKVYHQGSTMDIDARGKMIDMGTDALKRAMDAKKDYSEAMVYYNLMFREKAKVELDGAKKLEYVATADEWLKKALDLRKKQQAQQQKAADQKAPKS